MRRFLALMAALGTLGAAPLAAQEGFPSRPIRIITAFAPGSATDIIARLTGEQMQKVVGQNVIVENKPGAFGIVAIEEMARARPDGHTLMVGNISTSVLTPLLYRKKFTIDPDKDIAIVSRVAILPNLFAVTGGNFPPKTMAEFIAYAKERPGKVRYASNAIGSFPHYDMEIFSRRAGIQMEHIPYKGGPPEYLKDKVSGDIQASFVNAASSAAFIKSGQLRALAVVGERRLPEYPDVPTMAEVGFPGVGTPLWSAIYAPGATPPDVLEKLNAAMQKALGAPEFAESVKKQFVQPAPSGSLAQTREWLRGEFAKWNAIINEVKVEVPE